MRSSLFGVTTRYLLIGLLALLGIASVEAGGASRSRNALLIANASYPDSDAALSTPLGDLRLLSEELKRKGFSVEAGENLDRAGMQAAVERFLRKVEPGSVALVFFSGYGIQAGRRNYLVPVDARIWSETDVQRDGIAVDTILADLEKRGSSARVLVLDAARRNPFERRFRSFSAGLAELKSAPGLLALQSTAPGSVTAETRADTSSYVAELVKQMASAESSAEQAFVATGEAVARASRNQQKPVVTAGLSEPFSFDPNWVKPAAPVAKAEERPAPARPAETAAKPAAATDKDIDALVAAEEETAREFNAAMSKGTKGALEGFLKRHPAGPLAKVARVELARIDAPPRQPEKPVAATPPPPPREPEKPIAPATPVAVPDPAAVPAPAPSVPWRSPPKTYSMAELQRKASLDARITRNPRDATAYYERGQFHAQRDDYPSAIADFDQAIRLDPKSPEALNNRCWVRAITNEIQKALSDCNDALKLRPGFVDALDSRGFVNLKANALQSAIGDYDAALRLAPTHSSSLYGRGIARSRLGQSAQANDDLTRALALNPMIDRDFAQYGLR